MKIYKFLDKNLFIVIFINQFIYIIMKFLLLLKEMNSKKIQYLIPL